MRLLVIGGLLMPTPISAEDRECPVGYHADASAPYGCMSDPQYTDGDMDILTEQAYTQGYLAGAQDAIQDPEQAKRDIIDICGESGGIVAEDMSCVNPKFYDGPESDDDVAGEFTLPATH